MLLLNYTKTLWCVFLVHSVDMLNMFFSSCMMWAGKRVIFYLCKVSMMLPTHERTMIVIPAQGMIDVRDAMTDILAEYGKEETSKSLAYLWRYHSWIAYWLV